MCMNRIKDIDLIRHKGPAKILRRITGLAINCTTQGQNNRLILSGDGDVTESL